MKGIKTSYTWPSDWGYMEPGESRESLSHGLSVVPLGQVHPLWLLWGTDNFSFVQYIIFDEFSAINIVINNF